MPVRKYRLEPGRVTPRVLRSIPFTPKECTEVERAARKAKTPFSRFVREAALHVARTGGTPEVSQ